MLRSSSTRAWRSVRVHREHVCVLSMVSPLLFADWLIFDLWLVNQIRKQITILAHQVQSLFGELHVARGNKNVTKLSENRVPRTSNLFCSSFLTPSFNILHLVMSLKRIYRYALYFILNHLFIYDIYRFLYTLDMFLLPVLTGQQQLNVQFTSNILTYMHKSIQINLNHVLYCHKTTRDFEYT